MTKFLAIQNSYHDIELALFESARLIDSIKASKIDASKSLIPLLDSLLQKNSIPLSELKFIAANRGPGPFTTLRTVLASVNGLAFATKIPLIGVDSLDALMHEFSPTCPSKLEERSRVALLNAFNQDVYFAISQNNQTHRGCQKIQTLLTELALTIPHADLHFVGNGALMYQDLIRATFGDRAVFDNPIPEGPSIETIAAMGLEKLQRQEDLAGQLMPVYLK